ncbi:AP-3 complex subunit delta [Parastagonospora nodorum]|nr:AP-3 complex subunit delta [Parastagonospora nodorum]KAH4030809.1 AP-3 complex subunit delta [Parastagonospora nodorum]KAH5119562.1 AP-3 complex subunit delta [Parastagonospora nodorum]KAH5365916.1 AP-3 complex subunit delta [Parastagonospora nodorum]KAH5378596.1 AP-3 complex subunit delta [Parastagonospora nodorum]
MYYLFEKSLYDLIRGLRNHKGSEKEYIAESIKECRKEIRTNDMDLKATALMKLTYLEMFGHDMSWASFNVLEVMSSSKFKQKRTGYLAAVQSFRRDTEVLVLAENQLKKDIMSPTPPYIALPLGAIPHVVNPSMANSVLSDLIPRLTHSHAMIRKKTVVTLYRLALVYPETLRPAWPKIKERLQDDQEDPSVTAAIVNVVCELGWRRPQDFLPLAPRLFDLLVEGNNNWMAIKLIKLFATLTPLEPRLIKKLLPPLTKIIRETSAMSLLYECINGIIQGGILEAVEGTTEGEEVAKLCVGKLRGMMVIEGDSNLKYVALLAFEKIVRSHPYLVSQQQDVILECIDDPDISIRMRALDLVVGMVNTDNLTVIVGRLMRQLRNAPIASPANDSNNDRVRMTEIVPYADDDSDAEDNLRQHEQQSDQPPPLPDDYRISVIKRILEMCSRDTYSNISDFDWYIDVLVQLVRVSPSTNHASATEEKEDTERSDEIGGGIGRELQNVAIRVKSVRSEAVDAAQSLVLVDRREQMFPSSGNGGQGVLEYAAWLVGEFSNYLTRPEPVMTSLLHSNSLQLPAKTLAVYLQAIPKVFSSMAGNDQISWTPERKTLMSLLMARIIHFLEPLSTHPSLEVQERAVEYLELMRLAAEAASGTATGTDNGDFTDPPLLLTQAIPALFSGAELNPVAPGAQRKVPIPDDLDLDTPINPNLQFLLSQAENEGFETEEDDVYAAYSEPAAAYADTPTIIAPAAERLDAPHREPTSYQNAVEEEYLDPDIIARRKAERRERHKDDPFYIDPDGGSGTVTPLSRIVRDGNQENNDLDIDSIPIMDLNLERASSSDQVPRSRSPRKPVRKVEIMGDETLGPAADNSSREDIVQPRPGKAKKSLLDVDSSGLASLSLVDDDGSSNRKLTQLEIERREQEEAEMKKALQEVERLRLEMQRASERLHVKEEVAIKKKKKKVRKVDVEGDDPAATPPAEPEGEEADAAPVKKKKKKKVKPEGETEQGDGGEDAAIKKKKKKKRTVVLDDGDAPAE